MNEQNSTCIACGKKQTNPRNVLFDPNTFNPYCASPFMCTDSHPNAPVNIIVRGGQELPLLPYAEVQALYAERMVVASADPVLIEDFKRLMANPMSVRLQVAEIALGVATVKSDMNMKTITNAIHFLLQMGFKEYQRKHGLAKVERDRLNEKAALEKLERDIEEGEKPRENPSETVQETGGTIPVQEPKPDDVDDDDLGEF